MVDHKKIGIIGSGLIGRSWATIFLSHGYKVCLYDIKEECLKEAVKLILADLEDLPPKAGAPTLTPEQRAALISTTLSLEECIQDAFYIQECVFDSKDLKRELFSKIDAILAKDNHETAICSSTSVHLPSVIFADVKEHREQCLVAHPVNPPHYVPLVELVVLPETRKELVAKIRAFMEALGQKPVVLNKEISGFALNRLQYSIFQTAYKLVRDGIMSPTDVDIVVSDGLGPRYAFMGPWMTAHLNAHGLGEYMDKYAENIYKIGIEDEKTARFEGETNDELIKSMLKEVPLDKLQEKRTWRDKCLRELHKLKSKLV